MRAMTLTQPWAGLVASGVKLVENRPRRMVKQSDFGQPFAIHASRAWDAEVAFRLRNGWLIDASAERLCGALSAVIGVATIECEVRSLADLEYFYRRTERADVAVRQRQWFFGPIGYVLRDVHALREAVPCRGWQGFWTLPADVEAAVRVQLEADDVSGWGSTRS
jgi:hypothetical protein